MPRNIVHLPFPKGVRNLAISKNSNEGRDVLNSGTSRACNVRCFNGTVPI